MRGFGVIRLTVVHEMSTTPPLPNAHACRHSQMAMEGCREGRSLRQPLAAPFLFS